MRKILKIILQIIGWALITFGIISYLILWFKAFDFFSIKIGTLLTWPLVIVTNVVSPVLYIIWVWIAEEFPGRYLFMLLGSNIIIILGNYIIKMAQKYLSGEFYIDHSYLYEDNISKNYREKNYWEPGIEINSNLGLNPRIEEAWEKNMRAITVSKDKADDAISEFSRDIEIFPYDASPYNNRGIVYSRFGNYDKSLVDFTKAIELRPNDASIYEDRAFVYIHQNKLDLAIADFNKAIEINPEFGWFYYKRAKVYVKLNDYENALLDLNTAVEKLPEEYSVYLGRGYVANQLKNYENAISDFNKVIEMNPKIAVAYHYRGNAQFSLGNEAEANQDFSEAEKLGFDKSKLE
jgi:tetratricopeptide (TPR) repeat protein